MRDLLDITLCLAETLERLGVPYLVGGSLASSLHGIPRATQDVDLVAALRLEHVTAFVAALEASFYVDAPMIQEAIRRRSSFNVIHLETLFRSNTIQISTHLVIPTERSEWRHEGEARLT